MSAPTLQVLTGSTYATNITSQVLGEVKVEVFRFEGDEDGSRTDTLYSFTVTREYDAAVRVHWVGTSNGYYSETVDLAQLTPPTVAVPA